MRRKEILRILLVVLVAIFLMVGIAAVLLLVHRSSTRKEREKQIALEVLQNMATPTPTTAPVAMITTTPSPAPTATPRPTATPTPTPVPAFNPDHYWDAWYSTDGRASITIYDINAKSVSFYLRQTGRDGSSFCEADVTAEITGNVAKFNFYDSIGNYAGGNFIFDKDGGLYVKIITSSWASDAVSPSINCMMSRERVAIATPTPIPTPTPAVATPTPIPQAEIQVEVQSGDYYFADSNSRYLTDEELANYSSTELELAKNEIYARHGRQFVTERIAQYFESKSWYQGTVDPETFDAQQDAIFNEVEMANIAKIVEWEQRKRNEGN